MTKTIIYLSLMLTTALGSVFSQTAPLKFVQEHQKFGKIDEGKELYLTYEFVNEGDKPIIFNEAKVNCSCTVVTLPKEPINPNKKGVINIGFHTKGKIGFQERTVELITNQGNYIISFKGTVKASEETKEQYKDSHNHAH